MIAVFWNQPWTAKAFPVSLFLQVSNWVNDATE